MASYELPPPARESIGQFFSTRVIAEFLQKPREEVIAVIDEIHLAAQLVLDNEKYFVKEQVAHLRAEFVRREAGAQPTKMVFRTPLSTLLAR